MFLKEYILQKTQREELFYRVIHSLTLRLLRFFFLLKNGHYFRKKIIKEYLKKHEVKKLHVGSGQFHINNFLNTDIFGKIPLDITKKMPFKDETFDLIYSSHVLEHITLEDFKFFMQESLRLLKRGGKQIIQMPSLEKMAKVLYQNNETDKKLVLEIYKKRKHVKEKKVFACDYINSVINLNLDHKYLYDYDLVKCISKHAGYSKVLKIPDNFDLHDEDIKNKFSEKRIHYRIWDIETETYLLEKPFLEQNIKNKNLKKASVYNKGYIDIELKYLKNIKFKIIKFCHYFKNAHFIRKRKIKKYLKIYKIKKLHLVYNNQYLNGFLNSSILGKIPIDISKKLPFKDKTFDLIYSNQIIEKLHFRDLKRFLRDSYRILKENGLHIIQTISFEKLFKSLYLDKDNKNKEIILENYKRKNNLKKTEVFASNVINDIINTSYGFNYLYDFDLIYYLSKNAGFRKIYKSNDNNSVPDEVIKRSLTDYPDYMNVITETYFLQKLS